MVEWGASKGRNMDHVIEYLKSKNIPVNRRNYIDVNWLGQWDHNKPLPAELEAEMPEELQHPDFKKS